MIITPRRIYNQTLKKYRKLLALLMRPSTVVTKLQRHNDWTTKDRAMQEWIVNHQYRFLYCPVHKVASTSMAQAMLLLSDSKHKQFLLKSSDALLRTYVATHYQLSNYSKQQAEMFIHRDKYFKFVFVRNPWSRLVSAYLDKFVTNREISIKSTKIIERYIYQKEGEDTDRTKSITFRQFLHYVDSSEPSSMNLHWRPQHLFLNDIDFDFIGKLENLSLDFDCVVQKLDISSDFKLPYSMTRKANYEENNDIRTENYSDLYPCDLKKLKKFPNYKLFYSEDLIELVSNKYRKDIDLFSYHF